MITTEAKKNLYYSEVRDERLKIDFVSSSGNCICRNRQGKRISAKIGDLKKVY